MLRICGFKAPFRISSTPKGSTMPTALYVLIEDVVAVDGGGGQIYRYALRTRYLSSPYFRRMLFQMNCFWTGGAIVFAAAFTAIIFTVQENVAFTVSVSGRPLQGSAIKCTTMLTDAPQLGWTLPLVWAGVWTLITIPWVQSDLRREKKAWEEQRGQGGVPSYTDEVGAPTARTRLESMQSNLPSFLPWVRKPEKASQPPTPSDGQSNV